MLLSLELAEVCAHVVDDSDTFAEVREQRADEGLELVSTHGVELASHLAPPGGVTVLNGHEHRRAREGALHPLRQRGEPHGERTREIIGELIITLAPRVEVTRPRPSPAPHRGALRRSADAMEPPM